MPAPIVSWWKRPNPLTQVVAWNIGVVDAGTVSPDFEVLIFNNKGGAEVVSDMQNCTVTTKDNLGGNTGELVINKWIEVKVVSMAEATFTAIGGNTTRPIRALGMGAGLISGAINGGTDAATTNFAELLLHANVPSNASAGTVNFRTRVAYQFV